MEAPTPIACTLGSDDLALQAERWRRLGGRAGIDRIEASRGLFSGLL
jgi:hypothetical protein